MNEIIPRPHRRCIFCGQSPTSSEHLVPEWALKVLEGLKPPPQPGYEIWGIGKRFTEGADVGLNREWRTQGPFEFTTKCVCKKCNQGWMEGIESRAQYLITAMIEGRPVELDTKGQEAVATWLALKTIIAQHGLPPPDTASEWTSDFAANKSPPTSWHVRIGRYRGGHAIWLVKTGVDILHEHWLLPVARKRRAFFFTAQLGYFVGQVLAIREGQWASPASQSFIEIWPHPLLRANSPDIAHMASVTWPPERWLDESDLQKYSHHPSEPGK